MRWYHWSESGTILTTIASGKLLYPKAKTTFPKNTFKDKKAQFVSENRVLQCSFAISNTF